jgi:hypothetical protein
MDTLEKRINRNIANIHVPKYNEAAKEEAFTTIIERLYKGEALEKILKSDNNLPSGYTFFKWLLDPEYANVYAYAREVKAHKIFDECLAIADNSDNNEDTIANIQRDRLRLDARKFYLAKVAPKLYGDKLDVTTNGESINVVSLGVGIAPPMNVIEDYIDITPMYIEGGGNE